MKDERANGHADTERRDYSIYLGAMTLEEFLQGPSEDEDVPSFISPRWLRGLDERGLLTRKQPSEG